MAWVYILSSASGRFYIGSTVDLQARLEQHRRGHTHTTQRLGGDLAVAESMEMPTLEEARAFERELKKKKNPRLALFILTQRKNSR